MLIVPMFLHPDLEKLVNKNDCAEKIVAENYFQFELDRITSKLNYGGLFISFLSWFIRESFRKRL